MYLILKATHRNEKSLSNKVVEGVSLASEYVIDMSGLDIAACLKRDCLLLFFFKICFYFKKKFTTSFKTDT